MWSESHKTGLVCGIKYEILNKDVIKIYVPKNTEDLVAFKGRTKSVVAYLIDEGIFKKKTCQIKIVKI